MTTQLTKRLLTAEEYHKMGEVGILNEDDRIELINGEIIEMSPIGSEHAGCINRINALFNRLIGGKAIISVQNPIQIDDLSEPEPDIAVLHSATHFYTERHPNPQDVILIIEVAGSSLEYDRGVKVRMYASAGIPEYWIVNLQRSEIEVYRDPKENIYGVKETFGPADHLLQKSLDLNLQIKEIIG